MKQYLNLGCGLRYHPLWTNMDLQSTGSGVVAHDLSKGIPVPADSFDVVYHSHVLEHLRRADALSFMRECHRVLRPKGVLRVAVPDLETICSLYLKKLHAVLAGSSSEVKDYEWIMLEMYDQTVREESGGDMLAYLRQNPLPNEVFVYERIGEEGYAMVQSLRHDASGSPGDDKVKQVRDCAQSKTISRRLRVLLDRLIGFVMLSRRDRRALEIGRFRLSGEVHKWMYDQYSLGLLMMAAGFRDPRRESAVTSQIPDWASFGLDTDGDGTVRKPDSLFMECVKPDEQDGG